MVLHLWQGDEGGVSTWPSSKRTWSIGGKVTALPAVTHIQNNPKTIVVNQNKQTHMPKWWPYMGNRWIEQCWLAFRNDHVNHRVCFAPSAALATLTFGFRFISALCWKGPELHLSRNRKTTWLTSQSCVFILRPILYSFHNRLRSSAWQHRHHHKTTLPKKKKRKSKIKPQITSLLSVKCCAGCLPRVPLTQCQTRRSHLGGVRKELLFFFFSS